MGDVASTQQADLFLVGRDRRRELQLARSTNGGPWIKSSLSSYAWTPPSAVALLGQGVVFISINQVGIYRSLQNGDPGSWSLKNQGLRSLSIRSLVGMDADFIYAASDSGVFLSSNRGDTWDLLIDGLDTPNVKALALSPRGYLFAITGTGRLYRSVQSVTSVKHDEAGNPRRFSLMQNYPNPFNPTTTITFSAPHRSTVSLRVFDVLGREVATLLSGQVETGTVSVNWDTQHAASGVYFYRLDAEGYLETKMMLLLK
jgi:hypothetical protein